MKRKEIYGIAIIAILLTVTYGCKKKIDSENQMAESNSKKLDVISSTPGSCNCDIANTNADSIILGSGENTILAYKEGEDYLVEDQVLTSEQINLILASNATDEENSASLSTRSVATKAKQTFAIPWTNGIIYYKIASGVPSEVRARINQAVDQWRSQTRIKFVNLNTTPGQDPKNYAIFRFNGDGSCTSPVGMKGGVQTIKISNWCTWDLITHEIGHLVGMPHEQQRRGRNAVISVKYGNIQKDKRQWFNIIPGTIYGSIDFNSIMLYNSYSAYSINKNLPAMTRLNGTTWTARRGALSSGDIRSVKILYPKLY